MDATEALARLKEGNRRFMGEVSAQAPATHEHRLDLVEGQEPFAVILGCADSRTPAELIFDQGLGDLFVIRVAGNLAATSQIGSIEYAVAQLGVRLVVVLGHSRCGAIDAAIAESHESQHPPHLQWIVDQLQPVVTAVEEAAPALVEEAMAHEVRVANVRSVVDKICTKSPIVARLMAEDGLRVLGADYLLETGEVRFLD